MYICFCFFWFLSNAICRPSRFLQGDSNNMPRNQSESDDIRDQGSLTAWTDIDLGEWNLSTKLTQSPVGKGFRQSIKLLGSNCCAPKAVQFFELYT